MIHFLTNWFVKITGYIPQKIFFRTKIYYSQSTKSIRHIKGKAIIMSNHLSVWDMALLLFVFPFRTIRCLIAEIMYNKTPILSFFLKLLGGIRVERGTHDFSFVERSCKVLDKGGIVEIFPEARVPDPGDITPLEFKPSVSYMALLSGADIIPVYIQGKYFSKKRMEIIIGAPINVRDYYNDSLSEKENIAFITELLRGRIIELKQELQQQKEEIQAK